MTFLRIQNMFCEFGHVKLTIFRLTIFTVNATYIDTLAKFYPILISITNNDWRTSLAHIFHQWTSIFSWFGGIWSALYLSLNQVFLSWKTFIELIFRTCSLFPWSKAFAKTNRFKNVEIDTHSQGKRITYTEILICTTKHRWGLSFKRYFIKIMKTHQ